LNEKEPGGEAANSISSELRNGEAVERWPRREAESRLSEEEPVVDEAEKAVASKC